MRCKIFSMIVAVMFALGFWGCASTDIASDTASVASLDPQALIGRWEGSTRGLDSSWSSPYAIEIFGIDTARKKVMYRWMCRDCTNNPVGYSENLQLIVEKGKIGLQSPESRDWSDITWELKGDRLNGSARRDTMSGSWRFDYSLKKLPEVKRTFEPKELIGQWVWVSGSDWWELTISEVDAQNKTFKGKYMVGKSKREHDISNAKLISEGGKLKIDFKTINDTLHYLMTFYPNFGEYPPVLWGKLERMDGNIFYPMFRKKEKKDCVRDGRKFF